LGSSPYPTYRSFLQAIDEKKNWTGSYACPIAHNSIISATAISTQPKATKYLDLLLKAGAFHTVVDVPHYEKYPHGIRHYFGFPPKFIEVLATELRRETAVAKKAA
jgi:hypothetical protein